MVGQNSYPVPHAQPANADADHRSMLLGERHEGEVVLSPVMPVKHKPKTGSAGPRILGQSQRPRVDNCAVGVHADHRCQHAHRHIVQRARADLRLKRVEQRVVPRTHLCDAVQVIDVHHGRR